jgi:hypothetical protein
MKTDHIRKLKGFEKVHPQPVPVFGEKVIYIFTIKTLSVSSRRRSVAVGPSVRCARAKERVLGIHKSTISQ